MVHQASKRGIRAAGAQGPTRTLRLRSAARAGGGGRRWGNGGGGDAARMGKGPTTARMLDKYELTSALLFKI